MTVRVSWPQALAWRLERQFVEPVGNVPALEVARRLGGVQAQVASSADLAIRLRQVKPKKNEVADAIASGQLVKTWAMRGTLHLLPADEAGLYLSLLAAGRSWERAAWERFFGLSPRQMEGLRDIVREILDGRVLTRAELTAEIVRRPAYRESKLGLESGWGTLFKPLAWQGDIVFGPSIGSRPTFARPEQISATWRPAPPADDAAPLVIKSYLAAYGPATVTHVRNWLARGAVSVKRSRAWWAAAADDITTIDVEGEEMFVRTADIDTLAAAKPTSSVRLLGGFDQWVLGPGTDDAHVIPAGRRPAVSKTAGWIAPIVVVGGVVRGTWSLDTDRVAVGWFREAGKLPKVALEAEVDRLSGLVGRPLRLEAAHFD